MADEETLDAGAAVADNIAEAPKSESNKRKPAKRGDGKGAAASKRRKAKEIVPADASVKRRRYSDAERAEIIASVDAGIATGETLKASVRAAGVTEQSYYQWKKTAKAPQHVPKPVTGDIALTDLIELEAENQRLRAQLASKLRAENDELRKRLGRV